MARLSSTSRYFEPPAPEPFKCAISNSPGRVQPGNSHFQPARIIAIFRNSERSLINVQPCAGAPLHVVAMNALPLVPYKQMLVDLPVFARLDEDKYTIIDQEADRVGESSCVGAVVCVVGLWVDAV